MSNRLSLRMLAALLAASSLALAVRAAPTGLTDTPILAVNPVPPNVMLTLSVEWPTGTVAAYNDNYSSVAGLECAGRDGSDGNAGSCYFPKRTYLSYFDPEKCYAYGATQQYFMPKGPAGANRDCSASAGRYSGNYLNWATAHALDAFRWTMTGGDRYVDTSGLTVIEKSFHSGQGGYNQFPIKRVANVAYGSGTATTPATAPSTVSPQTWSKIYSRVTTDGDPLAPGTTRVGRVVQFANNDLFLNAFPATGGLQYIKIQQSGPSTTLALAEVQVLQTTNAPWIPCASENSTCVFPGPGEVRFGAGSSWISTVSTGSQPCTNGAFGNDPAVGTPKQCQYRPLLVNLAFRKPTLQSSTASGASAARAVDGNVDGNLGGGSVSSTLNEAQPWWQLDLGSPRTDIRAILVYNRTDNGAGAALNHFYVFGASTDLSTRTPENLIGDSSVWMYQQDVAPNPSLVLAPDSSFSATPYMNVRVQVCDPTAGLEANCHAYGNAYKPTGIMQDNADKMRFGVMGYLNVDGTWTMGGVLRSPLKYLGPNNIVPNSLPTSNPRAEITDSGLLTPDPESLVAADIKSSGAINYVNKFGKTGTKATLKNQDTVSEMFLEALRYVRGAAAATPAFTPSAAWVGNQVDARDGFPAYTNWATDDINQRPIQYACQKTYFVGIGDTNTWCDTYGPGDLHSGTSCGANHNAAWTDASPGTTSDIKVGDLQNRIASNEGLGSLGSAYIDGGRGDGYDIAGYAYFANTHDLLKDDLEKSWTLGSQHAQTYWVDVRETGSFDGAGNNGKNQYWLAGRYSGYTSAAPDDLPPADFNPVNQNYFTGDRPDTLNSSLRAVFKGILSKQQSNAPAAISGNDFSSSGGVYLVKYNSADWTGDVVGNVLSLSTTGSPLTTYRWNFAKQLDAQDYATGRRILSFNTTSRVGVPFAWTAAPSPTTLSATQLSYFGGNGTDQQNLINYLRGQRTHEADGTYRARSHLLGDIVDSQPVYVGPTAENYSEEFNPGFSSFAVSKKARTPMLYVGSNDGMLHAVDASVAGNDPAAGSEVFAYVPSFVLSGPDTPPAPATDGIASRANPAFTHYFLVDGQASARSVDFGRTGSAPFGGPDWHTLLVGGLGKGGRGYYALDVTTPPDPRLSESAIVGGIVKWEYTDPEMGYSYGKPIIAKTEKNGWVVILTSGYNTPTGKGFIVILNARTGALIQKIYTNQGDLNNPAGLAQANGFVPDASDFTLDSVYAGDLLGNVWRFDLRGTNVSYPAAPELLTTLKDAVGNVQPITTEPNIGVYPDSLVRWVFVGTGRLLDNKDIRLATQQSFYAIQDGLQTHFAPVQSDGTSPFPVSRANLNHVTYADLLTGKALTNIQKGWYFDFDNTSGSSTERMIFNSIVNAGVVAFSTQVPSPDPCNAGLTSRIYALDFANAKSHLIDNSGATMGFYTNSTTLLRPELVSDSNGKIQMVISTSDTSVIGGPSLSQAGSGPTVRLNWREIVQ